MKMSKHICNIMNEQSMKKSFNACEFKDSNGYSKEIVKELFSHLCEPPMIKYRIAKTALNVIENIKYADVLDWDILKLPDFYIRISYKEFCIDFFSNFGRFMCTCHYIKSENSNGEMIIQREDLIIMNKLSLSKRDNEESKIEPWEIYNILAFMFCAEKTEVVLEVNSKSNFKENGQPILNDTKDRYILVGSEWNIKKTFIGTWGVRGHFALRRCGKNRVDSRIVYINEYEKKFKNER